MSTRVTQAGDDPYRDIPGYTPVDSEYKGLTARDYASLPVSYLQNVASVAGAIPATLTAPVTGLIGGLFGGKQGAKTGWALGGGKDLETVYQDYIRPVGWNTEEGFTYSAPGSAEEAAAERGGYLQTLLAGGTTYDRAADIEAAAKDPRLMAELAAYNDLMARLRPEVDQAKAAVAGAYGQAAGAGRTAAGNIGTRGERTAATYEDLYGRAATEAGDLAQAGGTAVSGLTGPGQAFQDIYGGAYGLGGTEAYGTRGTADIAAEGMQARAGQAAGAGSRAAANIENYWSRMTERERAAFGAALRAKGYAKEDELKLKDQQVRDATGYLVNLYETADKTTKKRLENFFGPSLNKNNYLNEIPSLMQQMNKYAGPTGLIDSMIRYGVYGGATGG